VEAVSSLAGILATLWSINPDLSRERILDALVRSSNFCRETGLSTRSDWGRLAGYEAAGGIWAGGSEVPRS